MTSRFTLLGIDDEVTTCELCGKQDLKCTMVLSELDADGNGVGEVRYGRDCGARALGWKVSADRAEKLVRGTIRLSSDKLYNAIYRGENAGRVEVDVGLKNTIRCVLVDVGGVQIRVMTHWPSGTPTPAGWHPYYGYRWQAAA